jgi:hypothetical protein
MAKSHPTGVRIAILDGVMLGITVDPGMIQSLMHTIGASYTHEPVSSYQLMHV